MAAPPRLPRLLLLAGGAVLLVAGIAAVVAGIAIPQRLQALLPAVVIDAAAIGGATVALGVAIAVMGAAQVAIGLFLGRAGWTAAGVVGLAVLAALLLALGVALLTEVAAGAPGWVAVPGAGLLLVAAVYGAGSWRLVATRAAAPDEHEGRR